MPRTAPMGQGALPHAYKRFGVSISVNDLDDDASVAAQDVVRAVKATVAAHPALSNAFTEMAGDIDAYLEHIERMTSERVQASVEMNVARLCGYAAMTRFFPLRLPRYIASSDSRTTSS